MEIETAAQAAFEALHALHNRRRIWATHPDEDSGEEMGRNTFRHMMQAVAGTLPLPEPSVDHTYSAADPGAGLVPAPSVEDPGAVKVGGGAIVF